MTSIASLSKSLHSLPQSLKFFHGLIRSLSISSSYCRYQNSILLSDGNELPLFGLGCYKLQGEETEQAVAFAVDKGYRLFDTAAYYGNEREVGLGLSKSALRRDEYSIVTKLWHDNHGSQETKDAARESLEKLGTDYLDLYLIHGPGSGRNLETWEAMIELKSEGLIKSIGVSNFNTYHLEPLKQAGLEMPTVNQIELHPWLQQKEVSQYCEINGIALMGFCPLARANVFEKDTYPELQALCDRYNKLRPQILLRWALQRNFITIPKSSKLERIEENGNIFDFEIYDLDMDILNNLDCGMHVSTASITTPWIG